MKHPYILTLVAAALLSPLRAHAQAPSEPLARPAVPERRLVQDPLMLVAPGASIGVRVRELTTAETARGKVDGGVMVTSVEARSPAETAGFKVDDIVVSFDGERVRSVRGFTRLVAETAPGRTVKAEIVRGSERRTVDVTPESAGARLAQRIPGLQRDLRYFMPRLPQPFEVPRLQRGPRLGVTLEGLSDQLREFFGVSNGVLVSSVERDTPAGRAGLRAGDVITAVDGAAVRQPSDVGTAVAGGRDLTLTVMRDRKELTIRISLSREV